MFEYSSSTLTGTRYSSSAPVTRAFKPPPPVRSSRMRWRVIGPSFTLSSYHLSSSKGTVLSTDVCADAGAGAANTVAASRVTIQEVGLITPPCRGRIVTGYGPARSPGPGADAIIRCFAWPLGRRDVTLASGTTFGPDQILDP